MIRDKIRTKICGISTAQSMDWAVDAGANYIGFVFFEKSPRNVTILQARELAQYVPVGVMKVGLFVNPTDEFLTQVLDVVPLDMIQLHGHESPARVGVVKHKFGLPVMKAIGIADEGDLAQIEAYNMADQLLLDAKPPKGTDLPGGNGLAFDWSILKTHKIDKPWMLAGGLHSSNIADAIAQSGAMQVDVSSGVESGKGIKDKQLIESFISATKSE